MYVMWPVLVWAAALAKCVVPTTLVIIALVRSWFTVGTGTIAAEWTMESRFSDHSNTSSWFRTSPLKGITESYGIKLHHVKPHGALNNMACEDIELSTTIAKSICEISKDLIYLVPTGSKMEEAAKKLNMKIACEIFADRNYEDDGNLVSRKKPNALITDPEEAKKHVLSMVKNQALNCFSGKQIPCKIDSVCIHGDNESSLATAKSIKDNLISNGLELKPLNKMKKFN